MPSNSLYVMTVIIVLKYIIDYRNITRIYQKIYHLIDFRLEERERERELFLQENQNEKMKWMDT